MVIIIIRRRRRGGSSYNSNLGTSNLPPSDPQHKAVLSSVKGEGRAGLRGPRRMFTESKQVEIQPFIELFLR